MHAGPWCGQRGTVYVSGSGCGIALYKLNLNAIIKEGTKNGEIANLASDWELGRAVAVGNYSLRHIGQNPEVQTVLLSAQVVRLSRLPTNVAGQHLGAFVGRAPLEFSRPAGVVGAPTGRPVLLRTLPSCVCVIFH
jgi:glycerol uptake facilitator-like aquaporin